jgi:ribosomal protein S4
MRKVQGDNPYPWLTLDKAKMMGVFDSHPGRDQIEEPIEEQLVVELYSK